jgi:FkbM family methyltransferase
VVPLPGGERVHLTTPAAHRLLSRLYWEGPTSHEPIAARTWWCLAGDARLVADIGAFAGYYALLASRAAPTATIHAFEPLAEAADLLAASVAASHASVHVHRLALGAGVGSTPLHVPAAPSNPVPTISSTSDAIEPTDPRTPPRQARRVPMTTLNRLFPRQRVDLLKLDVEGAELDVLRGGQHVIAACTPDIVMEVHVDRPDPPAAVSWLVDRGYRIFDLTSAGPRPLEGALAAMHNQRRSATRRYGEILASTRTDEELSDLAARVTATNWPA